MKIKTGSQVQPRLLQNDTETKKQTLITVWKPFCRVGNPVRNNGVCMRISVLSNKVLRETDVLKKEGMVKLSYTAWPNGFY